MFSPYYAAARRRANGYADPQHHCAFNLALYGRGPHRWCMTERGRRRVERRPDSLRIGPSALSWRDGALEADFDELAMPLPSRVRGRLRLVPSSWAGRSFALDAAGRHRWSLLSPLARVEVELSQPALRWAGTGYVDTNLGEEPLEAAFSRWHWSRLPLADGSTRIVYDVTPSSTASGDPGLSGAPDLSGFPDLSGSPGSPGRWGSPGSAGISGAPSTLVLQAHRDGRVTRLAPAPPRVALPRTRWGIAREARCDGATRVVETLEDTPFYARSLIEQSVDGTAATGFHESLSLDRFRRRTVQAMLRFRMPRVA